MESVKAEVIPGPPKASRLEVIIRIPIGIILGLIAGVFGFIVGLIVIVNFFTCLILAKRVAADFVAKYVAWLPKLYAYLYFVTDERPPWAPE